jgi:hypothetical protein
MPQVAEKVEPGWERTLDKLRRDHCGVGVMTWCCSQDPEREDG